MRPSTAFVLRELLRRQGVDTYRLASGGLLVPIRNSTADVVSLARDAEMTALSSNHIDDGHGIL